MGSTLFLAIFLIATVWSVFSLKRARSLGFTQPILSTPRYYAALSALWCLVPAFLCWLVWLVIEPKVLHQMLLVYAPLEYQKDVVLGIIENIAAGFLPAKDGVQAELADKLNEWKYMSTLALSAWLSLLSLGGGLIVYITITPKLHARKAVERFIYIGLFCASIIAIFTTFGILFSVFNEAWAFFSHVSIWDFLTGTHWNPQTAIREDQVGSSGAFGAVPLFFGTLQIAFVAMLVAIPIGIMSAIYLSEYASNRVRKWAKPILELLAGIPTVVYGFFAALTLGPFIKDTAEFFGIASSSESMLAAGLAMGIMIIPFISSLSEDALSAVPRALRDSSYGLGATQSETILKVILPIAFPGIAAGVLLGISRAIGETMIVVMAAGVAANLTANPLESVTTVTVQIVTILVGDQAFDSVKTLAAFGLGLVLFLMTLILNVIALWIVRHYKEQCE